MTDDLESFLDTDTRKETKQGSNEVTNHASECASGHDYAKRIIDAQDNFLQPSTLRETGKESNESVTNNASGCVSVHDYAKKLVNENESRVENIFDFNMLREQENNTNEPSECVTNKDDSGASLHDYAKKIDVFENLLSNMLSTSIYNLDTTREMREYNQYTIRHCKPVTNNVNEMCVHNYAKKVTNELEGLKKNCNIGIDPNCLANTLNQDGRSLIHNYAKKVDENLGGFSENSLDNDRVENIGRESNNNTIELCKPMINDYRNREVASVHDYAKPIEKVIVGAKTNCDLNISEGTNEDFHNESTKLCKSKINEDTICGGVFVHDYAKKITHVTDDHILSKSISDKERLEGMIMNKESDEFSKSMASDGRVFGIESLHDYAKKITNMTQHEIWQSEVEMLQGHSNVEDEFNVAFKSVDNRVDRESKELVNPVADDDGICSGVSVHDYAKKVTNGYVGHERMSKAIYDIEMLEGKSNEVNEESSKPYKLVENNLAICNESSLNDDERKIIVRIDFGSMSKPDRDKEMLEEETNYENNKSNEPCRSVENEIHNNYKELDKSVPNNDEHFVVEHGNSLHNVCDKEMLEVKSNEVAKVCNGLSKSVETEALEGFEELDESFSNNDVAFGEAPIHYAKQITDRTVVNEFMSRTLCDKEMMEVDSNGMVDVLNADNDLYKLLFNIDDVCGGSIQDCVKEITNVIHDGFPDNECDIEMLEESTTNEVCKESMEYFKSVENEVRKADELDKSVLNDEIVEEESDGLLKSKVLEIDNEEGDSGWQSIRTVACLFCDDMFETASALHQHVSKYHRALKERLKIQDSEIKCKQCNKMVNYSKMYDHMTTHLPAENKCQYCHLVFRSLKRLEKHVNSHIDTEHFCCYCGMQFRNIKNKLIHISRVHEKKENVLCEICGLQFQSQKQFKIHLKEIHHNTSEYFCSYCGKEFSNVANKLNHMKLHTTLDRREILCEICGRFFLDQRSLASHQRLHENQSDFVCVTCTKSFETQAELDEHASTHLKSFSCEVCSKRFHKKDLVRQHMLSHSDIKMYSCFCGASFNRLRSFKRHTNKHKSIPENQSDEGQISANKFICGICKRDLKTETRLRWHEAQHAGEKKPFDCDVCGCRFARLAYYKVHMMKHTGERPYTCSVCQKGFRTQHTLQQHTAHVHMDMYSHKCDDCGQLFKQRNALTAHKIIHTGKNFH
ncbi:hypothetical protein LSTR_LSTR014632 [Laodelphax striatellus]|uniref:C2H2-type domain-containing protein n=1 Tax=Laodelphax striatellus TaxID=195883 RepID=A0A482XH03_LAOST|nr:hypothetical protein LSTR_LSTR014632 [Laodelphax striatellus]